MNAIERRLQTGHGPSPHQRRLLRIRRHAARDLRAAAQNADRTATPSAETMRARAAAIDELLAQQDHQT
jgi:hypothetical protein